MSAEANRDLGKELEVQVTIGNAIEAINDNMAAQFVDFRNVDGTPITSLQDVIPSYQRLRAEGKPRTQLNLVERAVVHAVDSLWVARKAIDEGLVTASDSYRLTDAIMADTHFQPSKALTYLRGTSPFLPDAVPANLLAGALEVHRELADSTMDNGEGQKSELKVSVPTIIKSAELAGLDLTDEMVLLDDDALSLIEQNARHYNLTQGVIRATRDGDVYWTYHDVEAIGLHTQPSETTRLAHLDSDSPSLFRGGTIFAELFAEDPENAVVFLDDLKS